MKPSLTFKTITVPALLASALVACGLFQPAPAPTTDSLADALPPAISSSFVSSVTPSAGAESVATNASVVLNINGVVNTSLVEANFAVLPGVYTTNLGTQKLTLTAMCNGRWRVRNPSASTAVFTWDVYNPAGNNPEIGSGIVPGNSDVYFTTKPGQKTARVFVGGALHNTKAANTTPCASSQPDVPGKLSGNVTWSGNTLTFIPTALLTSEQVYTVFLGLTTPHASAFRTVSGLSLSSVEPANFANSQDTVIAVRGTGFSQNTSFFIQSNRLEVVSVTPIEARLRVPAGFLPSVYGIMAANNDGTRATLYPAITVAQGPAPRPIDPQRNARQFVEGHVIDYASRQPLVGARISLNSLGGTLETTTDTSGYYLLRGVPIGKQSFRIEKVGYEPVYRLSNIVSTEETYVLKLAALEAKSERITVIGAAGGIHYATDQGNNGPFLRVPAGALGSEAQIQFTQLRDASTLPELPQDGSFLAFAHLGPKGLVFKKPATLFLPLQAGIAIPVNTPINIFYFDAKRAEWVDDITSGKISNVNGKLFLEYEINHFTWIGGTWRSDDVTGCVRYLNGLPAAGITTNYGVTNAAGVVTGTTTRSDVNRTLTFEAIDRPESTPVTVLYDGRGSVNFPCVTVADFDATFEAPQFGSVSEGGIAPFSTSEVRVQSGNTTVVTCESGAQLAPEIRDVNGIQVLMTPTTTSIRVLLQNVRRSSIDPSSISVSFRGLPRTQTALLCPRSGDALEIILPAGDAPGGQFKAGMNAEVRFEAKRKTGQRIERAERVHFITQFLTMSTVFEPAYAVDADDFPFWSTPTEPVAVLGDRQIVVTYPIDPARQAVQNFTTRFPVAAVNEKGTILPLSLASIGFNLDSATRGVTNTTPVEMQNGVAYIRVTFDSDDPESIALILQKKGLNIGGSGGPASVRPQFAFVAIPVFLGGAALIAGVGTAISAVLNNQQGAQAMPQLDLSWVTDWANTGIRQINATVSAGIAVGGVLIAAHAEDSLADKVRVVPQTVAVPTNGDCRPNGDGDETPLPYGGPEIEKWVQTTERAKGVLKAWVEEIKLVARTGKGTRTWNNTVTDIFSDIVLNSLTELNAIQIVADGLTDVRIKEQLRIMLDAYAKIAKLTRGTTPDYAGHHINSVSRNPELAGNPNNVAFIEKGKHIDDCHDGKTKNWSKGKLLKPR